MTGPSASPAVPQDDGGSGSGPAALRVSHDGWIGTPGIPVDFRGPVARPFRPLPPEAVATPMIATLRCVVLRDRQAIAVQGEAGAVRYGALWRSVARLAVAIDAHPARPRVVGVLLPPSAAYTAALFACLAAGRICVPLDAAYPPGRLADLAETAGIDLVLVDRHGPAAALGRPALPVTLAPDDESPMPDIPCDRLGMDEPGFILFTSGSTGRPKAVAHSQRTMMHLTRLNVNAAHLGASDRVLSVSSVGTLGGFNIPLRLALIGGSIQVIDLAAVGFTGLMRTLEASPVTVLRAGASLLRGLVTLPGAARALSGLRLVLTGGEPMMKHDHALLRRHLPEDCLIRSNYGATEAGGIGWFTAGPDEHDPFRVATGILFPDTEAMLVDDDGRPCPPGAVGELLLRSRYHALGEWDGAKVVPGRLRTDPDDPSLRIHATGDLARCCPDGVFVVFGRKDRMVKINGQRVEPGEIESVLKADAAVAQAVVVARQTRGRVLLCAFVVPAATARADPEKALREMLSARLPAFMVPSRIVVLDRIPLLPAGKVDEAALLALL